MQDDVTQGERLRIWQVDCNLLDAVLLLSFEPRELANVCSGLGIPVPSCGCPDTRAVVRAVHRACHAATPVAEGVERLLDAVHDRELEALETLGIDETVGEELIGRDLWEVKRLPGRLWALLGCPGERAESLREYARGALALDGLRLLAREAA